MSNTYTHTTLAQYEQIMALRLAETASAPFVRFIADELDLYLAEALRTFSALTGLWQDTDTQLIPANTLFVDLPTTFPALRGYTVLDQHLVSLMQYHLLEPKSPAAWTGSEMFTLAMFTQTLQRRRDQFLLETGCQITRHAPVPSVGTISPADEGQVSLDQSIIDVRRAAWADATGKVTPLWAASNWSLRGYSVGWNLAADLPRTYAYNQYAPSILQLGPPNSDIGTMDLLTVDAGAALNPAAGVLMGVPDDFTPFIKWGAMADLLSADGPAQDFARAAHCESMYQLGVRAAKASTVLIDARINNHLAQFSSLAALDASPTMRYWQNRRASTQPTYIAPVGLNLIALALPPAASCTLTLTTSTNAPIPAAPGSFIQVPKEYLGTIIGYAEHLAMFKIGGRELSATQTLAQNFFAAAQARNERLAAISVFEDDQRVFSQMQESAKPRRNEPPEKPQKGAPA